MKSNLIDTRYWRKKECKKTFLNFLYILKNLKRLSNPNNLSNTADFEYFQFVSRNRKTIKFLEKMIIFKGFCRFPVS